MMKENSHRRSSYRTRMLAVLLSGCVIVTSAQTAGPKFYADDPIARVPESADASAANPHDVGLFFSLSYNLFVTGRKSPKSLERWKRVAVASAKQCGRAVVPTISAVSTFTEVIDGSPEIKKFMCVDPQLAVDGLDQAGAARMRPLDAIVLVGPEGGWTSDELQKAAAVGTLITLGRRSLSADSLALVALSAMFARWGEF